MELPLQPTMNWEEHILHGSKSGKAEELEKQTAISNWQQLAFVFLDLRNTS
jgi:hypothetical protein